MTVKHAAVIEELVSADEHSRVSARQRDNSFGFAADLRLLPGTDNYVFSPVPGRIAVGAAGS